MITNKSINVVETTVLDGFSILVRHDETITAPFFGGVSYVINGISVGDITVTGSLKSPFSYWSDWSKNKADASIIPDVSNMGAKQAWKTLYELIFGNGEPIFDFYTGKTISISANVAESFDGGHIAFLIWGENYERFIWSSDRDRGGSTVFEHYMGKDTFKQTIDAVLKNYTLILSQLPPKK
jgi:hypothetical protein